MKMMNLVDAVKAPMYTNDTVCNCPDDTKNNYILIMFNFIRSIKKDGW